MQTQDTLIGTTVLEHFEIKQRIGSGSFATAYLAHQKPMDRLAVIKITHAHLMESDMAQMIQQRFEAEIRAATRVSHPNLVTLYTTGYVRGLPAFAMEYIDGISLEQWLQENAPLPEELLRGVVLQLLSALKALHQRGIIHRDLSPRNIMVTPLSSQGDVKLTLLDFGVAQIDGQINHTMGPLGTPRYMAPEQIQGQASTASDIYSFGAILWWMLTGQVYLSHMNHFAELFKFQLSNETCPDPREIQPSLRELDALWLRQLLHVDPNQRPTAEEYMSIWRQDRWPHRTSRELRTAIHSGEWHMPETGPVPPRTAIKTAQQFAISTNAFTQSAPSTPVISPAPAPAPAPSLNDTTLDWVWLKQQQSQFPEQTQLLIERFIGEMPSLLCSVAPGSDQLERALDRMGRLARAIGARNVQSLCTMYHALHSQDLIDDPSELNQQLEQAYYDAFTALMRSQRELV